VHGGAALPLAGQVESSQLMGAQGPGAVAPLHIGTRALAHGRQPLGLVMELVACLGAQRAQGPTGLTQRGAKALGACPKRLAIPDGRSRGHTIERRRGNARGVQGEGGGLRHVALRDLLANIPGDKRDGGWHGRHDALGFLDALPAALAEPFGLDHSAHLLDVRLDICGKAWAIATHPAFAVDTRIGRAEAAEALGHLCALQGAALVLTTGRFAHRFGWLQAHGRLGGAARTAFFGRVAGAVLVGLRRFARSPCFADALVGGPLCGGHRRGDRRAECRLARAPVRRVVGCEIMFPIGQETWGLITRGVNPLAIALRQGRCHACLPHALIAGLRPLCHNNAVTVGVHRPQAKAAGQRFVRRPREVCARHVLGQACGFVLAVGDHRCCTPAVHLLWSPLGGRNTAVQARQGEQETPQANAARPTCDADQRAGPHQPG
jgi:hypothetical protein